jgi:hypothetical protein
MTTEIDLDKLEQVARAASLNDWPFHGVVFQKAANPQVVLELVRRLRDAEADAKRLDFMAQHSAWIAWSKDHEKCRVFVRNEDGEHLPIMGWINEAWRHTEREAIDAAIATKGGEP